MSGSIIPVEAHPERDSVERTLHTGMLLSKVRAAVIINRLTVDGKDYFLPDPVTELKAKILAAVKTGGDYVTIPPLRGGPGLDILFSPGMPVLWAQIEVGGEQSDDDQADAGLDVDQFGAL